LPIFIFRGSYPASESIATLHLPVKMVTVQGYTSVLLNLPPSMREIAKLLEDKESELKPQGGSHTSSSMLSLQVNPSARFLARLGKENLTWEMVNTNSNP